MYTNVFNNIEMKLTKFYLDITCKYYATLFRQTLCIRFLRRGLGGGTVLNTGHSLSVSAAPPPPIKTNRCCSAAAFYIDCNHVHGYSVEYLGTWTRGTDLAIASHHINT
jgi:hypothetical protein